MLLVVPFVYAQEKAQMPVKGAQPAVRRAWLSGTPQRVRNGASGMGERLF